LGLLAVIAIGGNAILQTDEDGSFSEQLENIRLTCSHVVDMIEKGYRVVLTHGNGPQVGNILLRNELAEFRVPAMPMDVCVAESQGQIGYMIQQTLANILGARGMRCSVSSLITQVVVDEDDDAFEQPTKPIGPYYPEEDAERLASEKRWDMMEDTARGGYRRVVPSPEPVEIVESETIKALLKCTDDGQIIIAAGGGGIPVVRAEEGLCGVDAVVDKDMASQILATSLEADLLLMLTDVEQVSLFYGKPQQEDLEKITVTQAKEYLREGHFPPGSMGPKITAAVRFLDSGGSMAVITTPELLISALEGKSGTRIVNG
jgi:carbamate kinase